MKTMNFCHTQGNVIDKSRCKHFHKNNFQKSTTFCHFGRTYIVRGVFYPRGKQSSLSDVENIFIKKFSEMSNFSGKNESLYSEEIFLALILKNSEITGTRKHFH